MSNTTPAKAALRKQLQQTRLALGEEARHAKSEAIAAALLQHVDWSQVRTLHCFEPIMRLGEVDLVDFVAALEAGEMDVRVYTTRKLHGEWRVVDADSDQPVAEAPRFDVVIVPMLCFDPKTLQRLGYGGGYYDKFLAVQTQARKIGVCFEAGKVEELPAEAHDIPLDTIVTEQTIYPS